jgi:hypothetical protein
LLDLGRIESLPQQREIRERGGRRPRGGQAHLLALDWSEQERKAAAATPPAPLAHKHTHTYQSMVHRARCLTGACVRAFFDCKSKSPRSRTDEQEKQLVGTVGWVCDSVAQSMHARQSQSKAKTSGACLHSASSLVLSLHISSVLSLRRDCEPPKLRTHYTHP